MPSASDILLSGHSLKESLRMAETNWPGGVNAGGNAGYYCTCHCLSSNNSSAENVSVMALIYREYSTIITDQMHTFNAI